MLISHELPDLSIGATHMGYADGLFDLSGRVVLVTGGSRGLGREMALGAARCGADVVIASRTSEACAATAREIEKETGRAALPYAVHVGRWEQMPGLLDAVHERFGRLDVLVNNAGMSPVYEDLGEVTEKMFDAVVALNLKGPFRLSVLAGQRMAEAGGGSIVNVSSTGSIRPRAPIVPYAAAKAGLNAMTEGLAHAFGPTVRVNTLMCGPFATWATRHWQDDPEALAAGVSGHALRRIGDPREVVGAALYLMSDAASYTTGATLRVDGGMP
ncbi:SDR family NAD(P)-dependent oxidoreductase [Streptomyces sp. NL15-2K]|uniref:SDR family NAD(P)-dependent oxidoreductase n=1 Tax=Streptomyces sp. NL15-2K TaxID=376149 RepID=UPI00209BEF4F|nr:MULTISPECIES: glucose 1-dehydrogenase [Actinomycetes]WKX15438.1 glucose 1-dehydrogenase [Kutzneria buriramensis]